MIDLAAYLNRIGHDGARSPSLSTLQAMHAGHVRSMAFENLDVLLNREIDLTAQALEHKLIDAQRGGYCFEHNTLLQRALERLGFRVTGLAARVLWNAAEGEYPPHTHMLLMVELDGERWIVDVGFGAMTPTAPLRLELDLEQPTPHETFRLVTPEAEPHAFQLQVRLAERWKTLYQFDLQPQAASDYRMYNFYVSHYPTSRFRHHLIAARPDDGCRHTLLDNVLSTHWRDGRSERHVLSGGEALGRALTDTFGIALPQTIGLHALLERLAPSTPTTQTEGSRAHH